MSESLSESYKIVNKINAENAERFGDIQECCGMFEKYCRCESARIFQLNLVGKCQTCEEIVLSHRVCKCGHYGGEKITDGHCF